MVSHHIGIMSVVACLICMVMEEFMAGLKGGKDCFHLTVLLNVLLKITISSSLTKDFSKLKSCSLFFKRCSKLFFPVEGDSGNSFRKSSGCNY